MNGSNEKVSMVGIRNQTTLPKPIREEAGITEKTIACIQPVDQEEALVISLEAPEQGSYKRIRISQKGQFVVPLFLRESLGIKQGVNLVFTVKDGKIHARKLVRRADGFSTIAKNRWELLAALIPAINSVEEPHSIHVEHGTANGTLVFQFKKQVDASRVFVPVVQQLETELQVRLILETVNGGKIVRLSPVISLEV